MSKIGGFLVLNAMDKFVAHMNIISMLSYIIHTHMHYFAVTDMTQNHRKYMEKLTKNVSGNFAYNSVISDFSMLESINLTYCVSDFMWLQTSC